jgi:hypothetical protein
LAQLVDVVFHDFDDWIFKKDIGSINRMKPAIWQQGIMKTFMGDRE